MLYKGYDASIPPTRPLTGAHFACGYIGGNTPHVWTPDEWNDSIEDKQSGRILRTLPIWTADFSASPRSQAHSALVAAIALGWHRDMRRFIALDSETSEDVHFIQEFGEGLREDGFALLDYRSASAHIAAPSGYTEWIGRWDVPAGPFTTEAEMYQIAADITWEGAKVDLDICSHDAIEHFGRGLRIS